MTKLMCSCGTDFDTGAPDRTRDDLAYIAVRTQTIKGGAGAQKHPAADRFRPPMLQISCNRLSHVMRQGQRPFRTALAMHAQTSFAPIDIAQFEPDDLSCTQPEPGKQQQDGSIAQPDRSSPFFACVQKNPNAVGWHRSRNRRHRPSGDGGYCRGKIGMDVVAVPCEAEERPQCRDDVLCRSECAVLRRISLDVVCNLAGMHGRQMQFGSARYVLQKAPYISGVSLNGRRRQAAVFVQVRPVFQQDPVNSGSLDRSCGPAFDDAFFLEPTRYVGQSDAAAGDGTSVLCAMAQERFFMRGRNLLDRDTFPAQPSAEFADEERLLPIRNLRVPLIGEMLGKRLKIRSQRALDQKPRAPLSSCSIHRKRVGRFWVNQNYAD